VRPADPDVEPNWERPTVPQVNHSYSHTLTNFLPALWRRRRVIYLGVALASGLAYLFFNAVGERYESYALLRVGQGIKDKSTATLNAPFSEGMDLSSRVDSLARIVTTDHVIRQAASRVGFDRFAKKAEAPGAVSQFIQGVTNYDYLQLIPKQLSFLTPAAAPNTASDPNAKVEVVDAEAAQKLATIGALRDRIIARAEGRSDMLRITFRYSDPIIAAEFVNEMANALVVMQADLVQVPGADIFFEQQNKRLEAEAEKAGTQLRNFSVAASIYSVADQRMLLLKRADDLNTSIASTRGQIEDRKGQKQAILDQLTIMRPVYQSRTVTGIVSSLRGRDYKETENNVGVAQNEEAPPLLLVKVYQDAMASLLKVNTDLNGLLRVEKLLVSELEKINMELALLSTKEAEYDRLKRVLTRASAAADHYGSRVIEEQINLDIAKKTQLSSVRVIQSGERPVSPIFPRLFHVVMIALVGGVMLGMAMAVLLELAAVRRQQRIVDDSGEADDDVIRFNEAVRRSVRNHMREMQAAE
jgi:uncharacterized protein involved in exopolysaccharide biosynthesis